MADNPDLALGIEFFVKAVEHPRKSKEAGRPIYEDREYIRIRFPADNKRELVTFADEMHYVDHARRQMTYAERFRDAYNAFKADNDAFLEGTPLSELPFLTESRRMELQKSGVRTAEQLAGMPDSSIRNLGMGWREVVEQARQYLDRTSRNADTVALHEEIERLKAQIAGMNGAAGDGADSDEFDSFDREDLFNMATDAGLSPRANATADSLRKMLRDQRAKQTEAA